MEEKMTYLQAREALDTLVKELEVPDADLGTIAEKVKRATALVAYCRQYLRTVQEQAQEAMSE